jgi:hypothetical protein
VIEYVFKNSFKAKPVTVVLKPFSVHVQMAGSEIKIPYAQITAVRLSRRNGKLYKAVIDIQDSDPLVITNRFYISEGDFEDRNAPYSIFMRELHRSLKDKSDAVFLSGISYNSLAIRFLIGCFAAALIAFIAEFLGFAPVNSLLLALSISVTVAVAMLFYQRRDIAKQYNPADIPLQFLP